jgi:hypothetical protein
MGKSAIDAGSHWLNGDRVSAYPKVFVAFYLIVALAMVLTARGGIDFFGKPLGNDFLAFWSASHIALNGHAADAYDVVRLFEAEKIAMPGVKAVYAWFYPPTFYLLVLPLAWLPYALSYVAFSAATLAGFVAAIRRVLTGPDTLLLLVAFPGIFFNLIQGQNGFLTAALAATALALLDRRPVLAGVVVGLLIIKPHLAVLFPVALLVSGRWKVALAAGLTAIGLFALSVLVLNVDTAYAFLGSLQQARLMLENGALPLDKMPTWFAFARLLGVGTGFAYALHLSVAGFVIVAVAIIWRRGMPYYLRASALFTGTFLISPYLFDYDMVWLAFPMAWIGVAAVRSGWLRWEREIIAATWLAPLLVPVVANTASLQLGPLITTALFVLILRRSLLSHAA